MLTCLFPYSSTYSFIRSCNVLQFDMMIPPFFFFQFDFCFSYFSFVLRVMPRFPFLFRFPLYLYSNIQHNVVIFFCIRAIAIPPLSFRFNNHFLNASLGIQNNLSCFRIGIFLLYTKAIVANPTPASSARFQLCSDLRRYFLLAVICFCEHLRL